MSFSGFSRGDCQGIDVFVSFPSRVQLYIELKEALHASDGSTSLESGLTTVRHSWMIPRKIDNLK